MSDRQIAFTQPGAICLEPIVYEEALAAGRIDTSRDRFALLQGDVVTTESDTSWASGLRDPF